jgi:hypothetical protein
MNAGEAAHHVFPFAHGSVLALANHSKPLAVAPVRPEILNMLMKALLGYLFLNLTDGALCVDVCKLVLVNTRSCFLQETPLATAGNWRLPLCQALVLG